ncbi:MAG: Asp-tRNA(Asn)/Glu-tRNA(Gln) amidotransferase subunit GatB [Deltaproteobacteria bacterium]|nr:Asp-tRNA(Asn)/Glu-tRNA(Gln) amidotransferase subunit GatB [Deltaproteobacteria bacterium]
MEYEAVIGLEVHAQLKTESKIFCSCPTSFGAKQNQNTCEVCLGMPGALPVLNKSAVELAIKLGIALDCAIQERSIWDRKNYFYPDLPKGYQISQFSHPICLGGQVPIKTETESKFIPLTRIHMEEDAGKLIHDEGEGSLVDLNRAGTPLCEIVSEPALRTPEEAGAYLRSLRSIVRYADVCDGNMEQGSLRCDANVSIKPVGSKTLGTKVEIKNLNSVKFIEKAIAYEIERQKAALLEGQEIVQETRLYDSNKGVTVSMRSKEDSHDYRYFPDPDLVPLNISQDWITRCKNELPELPQARSTRFQNELQLSKESAEVLIADKDLADFFEETVKLGADASKASNWIMTELMRELNDAEQDLNASGFTPTQLADLLKLVDSAVISGKIAKDVFKIMFREGGSAEEIVEQKGLKQVSDTSVIQNTIAEIIKAHPEQVQEFKEGKTKVMGFFVGQIMKKMQGKANPQIVNELLKKMLESA